MGKYLPASVCSVDTAASILPSDSPASNPEPSAMSNGTSTVSKSSKPGSEMVSSTMPQSGTMSESSTAHPGVDAWISSLPHRPASPTPRQGAEREPAMIGTSSQIHSESLAKYSPEESMWRTSLDSQLSLKMDGQPTQEPWSENWPRSGMTVDGTLYPRKTLAHRISENGGGLLPTPVADGDRRTNYKQGGTSLGYAARNLLPTPSATKIWPNTANTEDLVDSEGNPWAIGKKPYDRRTGRPVTTALADVGQHFPTPRAIYGEHPGMKDPSHLTGAAMQWNTPNTMDSLNCKSQKALNHEYTTARPGRTNPNNLRDQVAVQEGLRLWPTPHASCSTGAGTQGREGGMNLQTAAHDQTVGGQLSATWVCWLMGIPLGWDSLDPLPEGAYEEWAEHMEQGTWWAEDRGLPRVAEGQKDRVNRLKMLGNGVVPASGALAFITLEAEG